MGDAEKNLVSDLKKLYWKLSCIPEAKKEEGPQPPMMTLMAALRDIFPEARFTPVPKELICSDMETLIFHIGKLVTEVKNVQRRLTLDQNKYKTESLATVNRLKIALSEWQRHFESFELPR